MEVIGDRWSVLVLRDVIFGNRRHFRILPERSDQKSPEHPRRPSRRLVADGLLTRTHVGPSHRAEYSLSEAVIQLVPVMAALGRWGAWHRRPLSWQSTGGR